MTKFSVVLILLGLLACSEIVCGHRDEDRGRGDERRRRDRRDEEESFKDLEPRKPREVFKSEGGRIELYDQREYSALCDAEIGFGRVTLERNGLALPSYMDSNMIIGVTKGTVRVGIISPFADKLTERTVFSVKRGDAFAVPRGFAVWTLNEGEERAELINFADSTTSTRCGSFQAFHLAGGAKQDRGRSVLQGFSRRMLAHAWDVDESMVQRVLEGQSGSGIIKVDERTRSILPHHSNNGLYAGFVYRMSDATPDVRVHRGGEWRTMNSLKLPILKSLDISAACLKLEKGAMKAPSWVHNADTVIYCVSGRGTIEVVRENGERAVRAEMEEGSLLVVPANYPCAKLAGNEGLDIAVFYKTAIPIESYLAGRNSVYKGMPREVVSTALDIDEKLQEKLEERRAQQAYIFPPREEGEGSIFL